MLPVTTIFVSCSAWEDIAPSLGGFQDPFTFQIPAMSKTELVKYLASSFPSHMEEHMDQISSLNPILRPIYTQFLDVLYNACSHYTTEPQEIAYMAQAMWPGYVRPVLEDWRAEMEEQTPTPDGKDASVVASDGDDVDVDGRTLQLPTEESCEVLVARFIRNFQQGFNALYSRATSARSFIRDQESQPGFRLSQPFNSSRTTETVNRKHTIVPNMAAYFPRRTRMMLVAAYIASFNHARTDLRMFGRIPEGLSRARRKPSRRQTNPDTVKKVCASNGE